MMAKMRRRSDRSHSKFDILTIPTALLFSSSLVSRAIASTEFSFFEHSSCNAGTAFYQLTDPNPLTTDLNCHQMPAGAVALYISDIDDGCTLRTYNAPNCKASSLSGLLLGAGTCFYPDAHEVVMLSWRADCVGVDYGDSNGDDHGNSYESGSASDGGGAGGQDSADAALVASLIATATGPVTVTASEVQTAVTKTVVPVKETSSASASSSDGPASSILGSTTASAAGTGFSSVANDAGGRQFQRRGLGVDMGVGMATSLGLVCAVVAYFV